MHCALQHKHLQKRSTLLGTEGDDDAPFLICAVFGRTELLVKLINEFGCSVNITDEEGHTVFHLACMGGHKDTAWRMISEYDCNPLEPDALGNNALHITIMGPFYKAISMCLVMQAPYTRNPIQTYLL